MRIGFIEALQAYQSEFGLTLSNEQLRHLSDYFELVNEHSSLLHRVAPCSPEEFAVRHILESLTMTEHLPIGAGFADVGSGAGLPAIPCLLYREDLKANLIESKEKKAAFLSRTGEKLDISTRTMIVNRQFNEERERDFDFVTCRALDKFREWLPRLLRWSGDRTFLFFGGPSLGEELRGQHAIFEAWLLPMSERRFLFKGKPGRYKKSTA